MIQITEISLPRSQSINQGFISQIRNPKHKTRNNTKIQNTKYKILQSESPSSTVAPKETSSEVLPDAVQLFGNFPGTMIRSVKERVASVEGIPTPLRFASRSKAALLLLAGLPAEALCEGGRETGDWTRSLKSTVWLSQTVPATPKWLKPQSLLSKKLSTKKSQPLAFVLATSFWLLLQAATPIN